MKDFHHSTHHFQERGEEKELESDQSSDEDEGDEDSFQEDEEGEDDVLERGEADRAEMASADETNGFTEDHKVSDDRENVAPEESGVLLSNAHEQKVEHGSEGRMSEEVEDHIQESENAAMQ